jgi:hypothetical protein
MHPDFSHAYKRYALTMVFFLLSKRFIEQESRYTLCERYEFSVRTLGHWEQGFTDKQPIKHVCFFAKSHSPPEDLFAAHLLNSFTTIGEGDITAGAAMAMTRLEHDFKCRLY